MKLAWQYLVLRLAAFGLNFAVKYWVSGKLLYFYVTQTCG
ncbi:hypothetical protein GAMM_120016 [Gammaproteobacteria bacterium]